MNGQAPETSPRLRDLCRSGANTRSCVGVKRLMRVPGGVKLGDSIVAGYFFQFISMAYEIHGPRIHEIFLRIRLPGDPPPAPISCAQRRHSFCTACPPLHAPCTTSY